MGRSGQDEVLAALRRQAVEQGSKSGGPYRVSAIVSTYRSERFMRGCLDDLLAQTIADQLEIVVIDSASPENEGALVKQYQQQHDNIVYLRTAEREGVYAAWNRGIELASGKYVTNANTDDRHRRDALELLCRALDDNPTVGAVFADSLLTRVDNDTYETTAAKARLWWPDYSLRQLLLMDCFGPHPMWRRSVHDAIGSFDPSYVVAGDYEFFTRLAWKFGALHLREPLGLYLQHQQSVQHANTTSGIEETHRLLARYRKEIPLEAIYPLLDTASDRAAARAAALGDQGNCCLMGTYRDAAQAVANYEAALGIIEQAPPLRYNLAMALAFAGRFDAAQQELGRLVDEVPPAASALQALPKLREAMTRGEPVSALGCSIFLMDHAVVKAASRGDGLEWQDHDRGFRQVHSDRGYWSCSEIERPLSKGPWSVPPSASPTPATPRSVEAVERPRSLHICYLVNSLLGVTGGNQTLLRQARGLHERGHQVSIVTRSDGPDWFELPAKLIKESSRPLACAAPPCDVVVATTFQNALKIGTAPASVRVYYAQGDQYLFDDPLVQKLEAWEQLSQMSAAAHGTDRKVIANSHFLAGYIEKKYGRKVDGLLVPGCITSEYQPRQRNQPIARPRVLVVGPDHVGGGYEPLTFKGMTDLRLALQLLSHRSDDFTLVRMSAGPAQISAGYSCVYVKNPSHEHKLKLYGTADILIAPSHYESLGLPPIEAMASGAAVIVTDNGGSRDYARHEENALVIEPRDPRAIADALERLLDDPPLRSKLARAGLQTAQHYTLDKHMEDLEQLMLSLAQPEALVAR